MFDLRELRWVYRVSQKDIALILGVSVQSVSNYELYKRRISLEHVVKLANHFDVSIDLLVKQFYKIIPESDL